MIDAMHDDNLKAKTDEEFYILIRMILMVTLSLSIMVEISYRYVLTFAPFGLALLLSAFLKFIGFRYIC